MTKDDIKKLYDMHIENNKSINRQIQYVMSKVVVYLYDKEIENLIEVSEWFSEVFYGTFIDEDSRGYLGKITIIEDVINSFIRSYKNSTNYINKLIDIKL